MTDFARINGIRQSLHRVQMQLVNVGQFDDAELLSDPIDQLDDVLADIVRAPLLPEVPFSVQRASETTGFIHYTGTSIPS